MKKRRNANKRELELDSFEELSEHGMKLLHEAKYEDAIKTFKDCLVFDSKNADCAYDICCAYSQLNKIEEAIQWLETAIHWGLDDVDINDDKDLENIRFDPAFPFLANKIRKRLNDLSGDETSQPGTPELHPHTNVQTDIETEWEREGKEEVEESVLLAEVPVISQTQKQDMPRTEYSQSKTALSFIKTPKTGKKIIDERLYIKRRKKETYLEPKDPSSLSNALSNITFDRCSFHPTKVAPKPPSWQTCRYFSFLNGLKANLLSFLDGEDLSRAIEVCQYFVPSSAWKKIYCSHYDISSNFSQCEKDWQEEYLSRFKVGSKFDIERFLKRKGAKGYHVLTELRDLLPGAIKQEAVRTALNEYYIKVSSDLNEMQKFELKRLFESVWINKYHRETVGSEMLAQVEWLMYSYRGESIPMKAECMLHSIPMSSVCRIDISFATKRSKSATQSFLKTKNSLCSSTTTPLSISSKNKHNKNENPFNKGKPLSSFLNYKKLIYFPSQKMLSEGALGLNECIHSNNMKVLMELLSRRFFDHLSGDNNGARVQDVLFIIYVCAIGGEQGMEHVRNQLDSMFNNFLKQMLLL